MSLPKEEISLKIDYPKRLIDVVSVFHSDVMADLAEEEYHTRRDFWKEVVLNENLLGAMIEDHNSAVYTLSPSLKEWDSWQLTAYWDREGELSAGYDGQYDRSGTGESTHSLNGLIDELQTESNRSQGTEVSLLLKKDDENIKQTVQTLNEKIEDILARRQSHNLSKGGQVKKEVDL